MSSPDLDRARSALSFGPLPNDLALALIEEARLARVQKKGNRDRERAMLHRIKRLEKIVEDLGSREPGEFHAYDDSTISTYCPLCWSGTPEESHEESCPWLLAREYVDRRKS